MKQQNENEESNATSVSVQSDRTFLATEPIGKLLAKLAANASVTGDEEIVLNAKDKAAVGDAVVKAANAALNGGKLALSG